ncbi:MAG: glucose-1-phosphate cytidylyltransferase, partial [Desulfatiglandales bacterium]
MKAVILAGGMGTRLAEETSVRPKPLVEIGGQPILWHIMKIYSAHGINEFIICLGYKGYMIKEYFINYFYHASDLHVDLTTNQVEVLQNMTEPWKITLIDTGIDSMTGGRLRRVRDYLGEEDFCFTYGDGLTNLDISKTVAFHKSHGKLATVTAVSPQGRFGSMLLSEDQVHSFQEKPVGEMGHINGGYFVLSPGVIDTIEGDFTTWEREPLQTLTAQGQLMAFKHNGFWKPMDTLREKMELENL